MNRLVVICTIIISVLSACEEVETLEPVAAQPIKYPGVDPELRPYFQLFEDEAALRGIDIDLTSSGITGVIEDLHEEDIAGQCSYPRNRPNEVSVDKAFWVRASQAFREFIVFHELGHCYLFRPHTEETLQNGACASIMRSGTGTCIDNYHRGTRAFYLDELFDWDEVVL